MVFKILWSKKALIEVEKALEFYDEIQPKLGEKFYTELQHASAYIKSNPFLFQVKFDFFREAPLKKFPYVVVYEIIDSLIIIAAVFHTSRNPENK